MAVKKYTSISRKLPVFTTVLGNMSISRLFANLEPQGPSKTHFHLVTFCDKHSKAGVLKFYLILMLTWNTLRLKIEKFDLSLLSLQLNRIFLLETVISEKIV